MNGRRATIGLCMLCALLASAFAAQGASAAGTTAFTCVQGAGVLRGEHCLTTGNASPIYGHVPVPENLTTEVTVTNAKTAQETTTHTPARLRLTVGGIPLELSATGIHGAGWMENKKSPTLEHYVHGQGTLTFTEAKVTQPAGNGCKVTTHKEDGSGFEEGENEVVHSRELTATTEGQGHFLKVEAADKGNIANFFVTCEVKIPAIEGTWSCNGSVRGVPNGATVNFTHAETTAQNTLKCKGFKAGLQASVTLSGRNKGSTDPFTPLAPTTTSTGGRGAKS
ncbi:MAG TPA: hypothetical protein VFX45_06490 [Solirubrobacterales bacterium]|nr:hypothetical protein [Solirubrobacterales bacterium]